MKILLICSAGTSTSLVVAKMKEEAEKQGKKYEIQALPDNEAQEAGKDYDVLLLGPQLKYRLNAFKSRFSDKPVDSIPPILYGRLDGKGVLELAEKLANK